MSIQVGVYDFFAYTIPGGIIVIAFGYALKRYQLASIDAANLSIYEIFVLIGVAYLVGYFVDAIVSRSWYKLFQPKDLFEKTMTEFNNRQESLKVNFRDMDWYIWFAFVKRNNNEMASDVNQLKVINLMLRNSSFGLFVFAILFLLDFVERGYLPIYVIGSVICLLIAFVLGKESIKFQKWFYEGIFQSAIALVLKSRKLPIQFESESKSLSENK